MSIAHTDELFETFSKKAKLQKILMSSEHTWFSFKNFFHKESPTPPLNETLQIYQKEADDLINAYINSGGEDVLTKTNYRRVFRNGSEVVVVKFRMTDIEYAIKRPRRNLTSEEVDTYFKDTENGQILLATHGITSFAPTLRVDRENQSYLVQRWVSDNPQTRVKDVNAFLSPHGLCMAEVNGGATWLSSFGLVFYDFSHIRENKNSL